MRVVNSLREIGGDSSYIDNLDSCNVTQPPQKASYETPPQQTNFMLVHSNVSFQTFGASLLKKKSSSLSSRMLQPSKLPTLPTIPIQPIRTTPHREGSFFPQIKANGKSKEIDVLSELQTPNIWPNYNIQGNPSYPPQSYPPKK